MSLLTYLAVLLFSVSLNYGYELPEEKFVETIYFPESQTTVRLKVNNTVAAKTSFHDFSLTQITDGMNFYQFWTFKGDLIDCGFENDPEAVSDFLDNFIKESCGQKVVGLNQTCNPTNLRIKDLDARVPEELDWIFQMNLEKKCRSFHEGSRLDGSYRRRKRDILFPGTNWCGSGFSSKTFKELGVNAAADRCCRDHDHCKHYILPFSWKYHLFNYRFHTVSHCRCDRRFKDCLKSARTPVSDMIGKLFFNIAKTKCFSFKREKTCKKRSWWGKCLKTKKSKKAFFKAGISY